MADRRAVSLDPAMPHDLHDVERVAASAAGDADAAIAAQLDRLLAACGECRALVADLRAIASATRALSAVQPAAPRDFRLAPADAARLGRRSVGVSMSSALRGLTGRLGTGMIAAGIVGVVLAGSGLSLGVGGGATAGARPEAASQTTKDGAYGPAAGVDAQASPRDLAFATSEPARTAGSDTGRPLDAAMVVTIGSVVLLGVGLALLALALARTRERG